MQHHFDIDIATEYGVNAAIMLENLRFWIVKNEANEANFFDGCYWTYNSVKAFESLFPYMSTKAIRNTLKLLEDEGLVLVGNYNKSSYDRTKWYALTGKARALFQKGASSFPKGQLDLPKRANGSVQKGEPIPDRNPDGKPSNKDMGEKRKRFTPPTIEEVKAYCLERNNAVDPHRFIDYYESKGWTVGKSKMKDWKAAVRTWENNGFSSSKPKPAYIPNDTSEWPSFE